MSLNPLDFRGPEFLVFFALYGLVVVFFVRLIIKIRELRYPIPKMTQDFYEIAYLRGGAGEAVSVALFSLIDRGLVKQHQAGGKVKAVANAEKLVRRNIEKEILKSLSYSREIWRLRDLDISCVKDYQDSLKKANLISDDSNFLGDRFLAFAFGFLAISAMAFAKIEIAISRGRYNFFFLLAIAVAYVYWIYRTARRERTFLGDRILADLEQIYSRLRDRASRLKPGGETNEAAMAAAVFGLAVLSPVAFPRVHELSNNQKSLTNPSSWDTSGSVCGGGSSCGSSCGGGCGGGCGGCGS